MTRPSAPDGDAGALPDQQRLQQVLRQGVLDLADAGVASPRVDAELLMSWVLGVPRARLVVLDRVPDEAANRFRALVGRRAGGHPVQHLTGEAPFRHLLLAVGPGVFIPRPETELLLDLAAGHLRAARCVVDLCSGTGALALAAALEFPQVRVTAVELSEDALPWLRRNVAAHPGAPVTIVAGDATDSTLLTGLHGVVDVVLSNPPYVPATLRGSLGAEVAHDPETALFGGADGLALMPGLIASAALLLRPGGLVAFEHDESHETDLPELFIADGRFEAILGHRDLAGRPRFTTARRR